MPNLLRNPFKDSKFFKEWKYGLIEGLGIAFVITLLYMDFMVYLNLAFLIAATVFSFMAWQGIESKDKVVSSPERTYTFCPECGNKTKHKPTCTLGRKKKE